MSKPRKNKASSYPCSRDVKELYSALDLQNAYRQPYNRESQLEKFSKVSLYTDDRPCYATGTTREYAKEP